MDPDFAIELGREMLWTAVLIGGPILMIALATGLLIGMFQAATQINEQTMSFVPKLGMLVVTLWFFSPWMLDVITGFAESLFHNVPHWVG